MSSVKHPSSFRDPSGFIFSDGDVIYRQVNKLYQGDYDLLMESGLYETLAADGLLIPHEEVEVAPPEPASAYKVLRPQGIPYISYPYEWCFSQLRDAALTTLTIQKKAIKHGMSLKDSSAYNIQFLGHRPVFIDTLSFEKYQEGSPWVAYRQFCQHFLAPLALMSYRDVSMNLLMRAHIDGVSLPLASQLLPTRTKFKYSLLSHIHIHAKTQQHYADKKVGQSSYKISQFGLLALIDSLESAVKKLKWKPHGTEWADYYNDTNYSPQGLEDKKSIVDEYLEGAQPEVVWDLGSNVGVFSRIASQRGIPTVSFDIDPSAVEKNYLEARKEGGKNLLPLVSDLTNPSPSLGWANEERTSWVKRGPVDLVMALALTHHLALSNNLPFIKIAHFFGRISGDSLIVEFIPKEDSQVQRLLASREDIFPHYDQAHFEQAFGEFFTIQQARKMDGSNRTLYWMKKKALPS